MQLQIVETEPRITVVADGSMWRYEVRYAGRITASGWVKGRRAEAFEAARSAVTTWKVTGSWTPEVQP